MFETNTDIDGHFLNDLKQNLWGSKNVDNVHAMYVKFPNAQVKSKHRQLDALCRQVFLQTFFYGSFQNQRDYQKANET